METTKQKLWTVDEYYRMADAGILDLEERTELIDGQIIVMSAKKPPHSIVNQLAADYLRNLLIDTPTTGSRGILLGRTGTA